MSHRSRNLANASQKVMFRLLGYALFAIGVLGALLPLLPTTIFWILAVPCLLKADDPFAHYLFNHPRFGKGVRDWFGQGAICRKGKIAATASLAVAWVILWQVASLGAVALSVFALGFLGLGYWLITRPTPRDEPEIYPG